MTKNPEQTEAMTRRRKVRGISAVLLPYTESGQVDERAFREHLDRTLNAGLNAAVNMDTGYVELLTPTEKSLVLEWTHEAVMGREPFLAGALPQPGNGPGGVRYARECDAIHKAGGVPVIFPSAFTASLGESALCEFFSEIARSGNAFLAFELGPMFSRHGRVFSERVLKHLMSLPDCVGLKHSSLDRKTEIERLRLRDAVRPDFAVYSGNDLAMDMIEYGSDYLLGLSTFAPEAFAARDKAWCEDGPEYLDLRDALQYLGWLAFRDPVPGYKHSAAIFLKATGWLETSGTHTAALRRETWDHAALVDAARRLERVCPAVRKG